MLNLMEPHNSIPTFEFLRRVEGADIDTLGHVNNIVYLQWVQEAAIAHWRSLAPAEHQAEIIWMVLRHEIDYKQQLVLDDEIVIRTWIGAAEGLRFERFTEILRNSDQKQVIQARTLWCPIDPKTGRPRRVPPEIRALFSTQ